LDGELPQLKSFLGTIFEYLLHPGILFGINTLGSLFLDPFNNDLPAAHTIVGLLIGHSPLCIIGADGQGIGMKGLLDIGIPNDLNFAALLGKDLPQSLVGQVAFSRGGKAAVQIRLIPRLMRMQ